MNAASPIVDKILKHDTLNYKGIMEFEGAHVLKGNFNERGATTL